MWGLLMSVVRSVWMGRWHRRLTGGERQLLDLRIDVLVRNRRPLIKALGLTAAVCLVDLLLPGSPEYRGFVAGVVAASTWWMLVLRLRQVTERQTKGVEAEARSAELLSSVPQWHVVNDVFVQGRNVDHIVITPLAVLAVEAKWWAEASPKVHAGRRQAAVEQARKNARTVKHLLRSKDLGFDLPVRPVVLVWGPGAEAQVGGVDVVVGDDAGIWIAAYQTGAIHPDLAAEMHAALLAYQARTDHHRFKTTAARTIAAA